MASLYIFCVTLVEDHVSNWMSDSRVEAFAEDCGEINSQYKKVVRKYENGKNLSKYSGDLIYTQ